MLLFMCHKLHNSLIGDISSIFSILWLFLFLCYLTGHNYFLIFLWTLMNFFIFIPYTQFFFQFSQFLYYFPINILR